MTGMLIVQTRLDVTGTTSSIPYHLLPKRFLSAFLPKIAMQVQHPGTGVILSKLDVLCCGIWELVSYTGRQMRS